MKPVDGFHGIAIMEEFTRNNQGAKMKRSEQIEKTLLINPCVEEVDVRANQGETVISVRVDLSAGYSLCYNWHESGRSEEWFDNWLSNVEARIEEEVGSGRTCL